MTFVDNPIARECATCGARSGQQCMTGTGKFLSDRFHQARKTGHRHSPEALEKTRAYGQKYYQARKAGS